MNQREFDHRYRPEYYQRNVSPRAAMSAPVIAETIVSTFAPRTCVDVGCGTGELMLALGALGVRCWGFDRATYAVGKCRQKGLTVYPFDLEVMQPDLEIEAVDVAICMEVAEHIRAMAEAWLVWLLCQFAPVTVFTAAPPGQGGNGHVNEQSMDYWIELFATAGRRPDQKATRQLSILWQSSESVESWYYNNLMVFRP